MINVYDIETYKDNETVVPYCICMIIHNKEITLYYEEKKNIIIESLNKITDEMEADKIEIFVHNLNFDGLLIINEITKNNITYKILSIKTNIYYVEIIYSNKKIKFRCSYKILPLSLREIGDIEKWPKLFFPYNFVNPENLFFEGSIPSKEYWEKNDYEKFCELNHISVYKLRHECIKYCMNDVYLTKKFLINILFIINSQDKDILKFSYSAASISHKLYFKKYNFKQISEQLKKSDEEYIRKSYFGGRCEVFGNINSDEHIKYFDYSGMYGQCMLESFHNGSSKYYINADWNLPGFHTIEYESNSNVPVLPSHSQTGKLLFSNGKKIGTFWFEEIKLFENNGGKVIKSINSLIYEKYEEVFTDFVKFFTKIRENGGYYKIFGKLVINSLYGSMALKSDKEIMHITFSESEFYNMLEKTNVLYWYKVNLSYIIIIKYDYKSKKYFKYRDTSITDRNVSYASAIASKARIKLYNAFKDVESSGGRLLYCDTDSIFAAYPKSNKNAVDCSINWLNFYTDGVFIAPKTYALRSEKEDIKIKGISFKNLSFDKIKSDFYNERDIIFDNQLIFRKMNFSLKQSFISKKININTYDKRIFINNKKETMPIRDDWTHL